MLAKEFANCLKLFLDEHKNENDFVRAVRGFRAVRVAPSPIPQSA
jgi:hypothetical protein